MRELTASDRNVLTVNDARSGTEMELYYRTPTSREDVLYSKELVKKKGKKVVFKAHETRLKYGLAILTGFREGDFGADGRPISTEPGSPNYREDWKDLVEKGAADIVKALAMTVFEGVKVGAGTDLDFDLDEEGAEGEAPGEPEGRAGEAGDEEEPPLGRSSAGSSTDAPRS